MTNADADRLNQQLAQDQTYQALLSRLHGPDVRAAFLRGEEITRPIWDYLQQRYGVTSRTNDRGGLMGPQGWKINAQGQLVEDHDTRTGLLTAAALGAGGYAASLLPGVGLTGGAAVAPAGSAAGTTAGTAAAAGGAAAASPSIWKSILGPAIGAGASLGGAAIASKGISDAAKTNAEASEKALALQREMFGLDLQEQRRKEDLARADFAPYGSIGRGALGLLAQGTGIDLAANPMPTSPPTNYGSVTAAATPPAQTGTLASINPSAPTTTQPQAVSMVDPRGRAIQVPAQMVAEAQQRGARMA